MLNKSIIWRSSFDVTIEAQQNQPKIGMNSLVNKFDVLNNQIKLLHFNLRLNRCKNAM